MDSDTQITAPYPLRTIVLVGVGAALCSFLFTLTMFWIQQTEPTDHIAGEVVSVTSDTITIKNARGATTTILLSPDTKIGDIDPLSSLATRTPIMAGGTFITERSFAADGVRMFHKRPK